MIDDENNKMYLGAVCGLLFVFGLLLNPYFQQFITPLGLYSFPPLKVVALGLLFALILIAGKSAILSQLQKRGLEYVARPSTTILRTIVTATIPPVTEEIFCRGILQSQIGILGASLIFAWMHVTMVRTWNIMTAKLFAGLCLGLALFCTGNIWTPIIAHAVSNFWFTSYGILRNREIGIALKAIKTQDFQKALEAIQKMAAQDRDAYSYRLESIALRMLGKNEEAVLAATSAINKHDPFALSSRSEAYLKLDQIEKARIDLNSFREKFPKVSRGHQLAAELAIKGNRYADAAASYEKAYAIDKRIDNLALACNCHYKQGEFQTARTCCQKVLAKDAKNDLANSLVTLLDLLDTSAVENKNGI